jgi:DnaJ like chaperone protein
MKKVWGKFVGGALGLAMGGPLGGVLGFIVGHAHDVRRDMVGNAWDTLSTTLSEYSGSEQQKAFTQGIIVLGAKMAKADGRVTQAEIEAFKRVFQVAPSQVESIGRLFDRARSSSDNFEPYAFQLSQMFRSHPMVLEQILSNLFIIAAADGIVLSYAEVRFLKRVSFIFSFNPQDFARIAAGSGVRLPDGDGPDIGPNDNGEKVPEPFAILGVRESTSSEDIKLAYRALIREHHPDKLVAQGMPPEFVATANEKMKRINVAYDTVCRIRGIK